VASRSRLHKLRSTADEASAKKHIPFGETQPETQCLYFCSSCARIECVRVRGEPAPSIPRPSGPKGCTLPLDQVTVHLASWTPKSYCQIRSWLFPVEMLRSTPRQFLLPESIATVPSIFLERMGRETLQVNSTKPVSESIFEHPRCLDLEVDWSFLKPA
jgi:hypothetical protein